MTHRKAKPDMPSLVAIGILVAPPVGGSGGGGGTGIYFQDNYSDRPAGAVVSTDTLWTNKGYNLDPSNLNNVNVLARSSFPAGLLTIMGTAGAWNGNNASGLNSKSRLLKTSDASSDSNSYVEWWDTNLNKPSIYISMWEYRDNANSGNEKFQIVSNIQNGTGNRQIEAIWGFEHADNTGSGSIILFANSANMFDFGNLNYSNTGLSEPSLNHWEYFFQLSTGINADGAASVWKNGNLVGSAQTGIRYFLTASDASTYNYWQNIFTGGWSSGTTNLNAGTPCTFPQDRYFLEVRYATSRQGVWAISNV